jgi:hypothetical protein
MKFYKIQFKTVKQIVNEVFPEYKGRKVRLVIHDSGSMSLSQTYWSGGCRSYYAGLDLTSGQFGHLKGTNVYPSFSQVEGLNVPLTDKLAVLEHRYSGCSQWIWIHINPCVLSNFEHAIIPELKENN